MNNRLADPFYPLGLSQSEREIKVSAAYLDNLAYGAVKAARSRDADHPEDMLSAFLQIPGVTDTYLRDAFMNLLLAGRDTTSQTLSW